jgi:alkyl hydroperoxide reductase subunit F
MGRELAQKFVEQVNSFPVAIRMPDEVIAVGWDENIFLVQTKYEATYKSKALIIASGKQPRTLNIPNEKNLTGRGVSYCATCDAPLYHNKDTVIIGGANSAVLAALDLSKIARRVYLIVRSKIKADPILADRLDQAGNVEQMVNYLPVEIKGKDKVESLVIKHTETKEIKELVVQGVFVEAGLIPNTGFLRGLVKTNERYEIIVNCNCETSEKGIFACGDVTNVSDKQIIIACGEGAKATLSAYRYLMSSK